MLRARLIKKSENTQLAVDDRQVKKSRKTSRRARKVQSESGDAIRAWVDDRRKDQTDPRKAFAALFS